MAKKLLTLLFIIFFLNHETAIRDVVTCDKEKTYHTHEEISISGYIRQDNHFYVMTPYEDDFL